MAKVARKVAAPAKVAAPTNLDHWAATLAAYATLTAAHVVAIVAGVNPWAPTAKGGRIWALLAAYGKGGTTMAALCQAAKAKHGIGAAQVAKDVCWLYTWHAYPRSCTPGLVVHVGGHPYAPGKPMAAPKAAKAAKAAPAKAAPAKAAKAAPKAAPATPAPATPAPAPTA